MKILNLNEGFFPIKLDFEENELNAFVNIAVVPELSLRATN